MTSIALTIAGIDSGGASGIAADVKTFAAFGVHGTAVITAVTAQNSSTVAGVEAISPAFVTKQIETVYSDMPVASVKTGMLANAEIVGAVTESLTKVGANNIVIDPVMISTSGAPLISTPGILQMTKNLFPMATLVTPNIPEAEALTNLPITDVNSMKMAAAMIAGLGPKAVLIKGGHMDTKKLTDLLYIDGQIELFERERIDTKNTRGTGCAFSSAITACLAKGFEIKEAVAVAEKFIDLAIRGSYKVGKGDGPIDPLAWCDPQR